MANQDIKLVVSEFRIGFWNIMNKIDESEIFCMFLLVHASFVSTGITIDSVDKE